MSKVQAAMQEHFISFIRRDVLFEAAERDRLWYMKAAFMQRMYSRQELAFTYSILALLIVSFRVWIEQLISNLFLNASANN